MMEMIKLRENSWASDFFVKLAKIYIDDADAIEIIEDAIYIYGEYTLYVYKMESLRSILKTRLESEEYINKIQEMDKNRTIIHNSAISSTKVINRLCEAKELPLFFKGNIEDRVEIAEFIKDVVVNIFENRKI